MAWKRLLDGSPGGSEIGDGRGGRPIVSMGYTGHGAGPGMGVSFCGGEDVAYAGRGRVVELFFLCWFLLRWVGKGEVYNIEVFVDAKKV